MRPIRALPSSDEPSDQPGGTPAQTARRSYGSAPLHCESSRPPTAPCRVWALAAENLPGGPAPESGHGRTPQRPARVVSHAGRDTGQGTPPPAGGPPGRAARPRVDRPRSRWLGSPRLRAAGPARHRLRAAPSRSCREPRGWAPSARPFFCWRLGAVQQHLVPVAPLQGFRALSPLAPRGPKRSPGPPDLQPPLARLGGRKAGGQHPPPHPRDEDGEHGRPTFPVVVGRTPIATPDPWREKRGKEHPHVLGHLPGKVG
jgi:hypothetical protein